MSRSNAQIRFQSGIVVYGLYNGTVGSMFPRLFTSQELAWKAFYPAYQQDYDHKAMEVRCRCGHPPEDVEIAVDFGRHWPGLACIHCWCLVDGFDPYRRLQRDINRQEAEAEAAGIGFYTGAIAEEHTIPEEGLPDWWIHPDLPRQIHS